MSKKETLMQRLRRLFGRAPAASDAPPPVVHPNDDVRGSIHDLCKQIDEAHEEKKSRSIECRPPVANGSH